MPIKDLGTREIQQHREKAILDDQHLIGTMASLLLYDNVLGKGDVGVLLKLYTLRRCYLGLITNNIDGKSYFPSTHRCIFLGEVRASKYCSSLHHYQRENKDLEKRWKKLRVTLRHHSGHAPLHFLENLFALLPYESMTVERARFYRHYPKKTIQSLAYTLTQLAKEVLQD
ncbi:MAG: hypothetical protein K2X98_01815 [Alphaproteobacteria bacterium]|nr:hypothetical protein [Alphaproteobacteria bacterium]